MTHEYKEYVHCHFCDGQVHTYTYEKGCENCGAFKCDECGGTGTDWGLNCKEPGPCWKCHGNGFLKGGKSKREWEKENPPPPAPVFYSLEWRSEIFQCPILNSVYLEAGEYDRKKEYKVEVLWPDGFKTKNSLFVQSKNHYVRHLGRYCGDEWIEDTHKCVAWIEVPMNGVKITYVLDKETQLKFRLLEENGKKEKQ